MQQALYRIYKSINIAASEEKLSSLLQVGRLVYGLNSTPRHELIERLPADLQYIQCLSRIQKCFVVHLHLSLLAVVTMSTKLTTSVYSSIIHTGDNVHIVPHTNICLSSIGNENCEERELFAEDWQEALKLSHLEVLEAPPVLAPNLNRRYGTIMDIIYPNNQNDNTISIGCRVAWHNQVWSCDGPNGSYDDNHSYSSIHILSGVAKRITPYTIIILVDAGGWHKSYLNTPPEECLQPITPYEIRLDKARLVSNFLSTNDSDILLRDAIQASIGISPNKPRAKDVSTHVVYTLSDPRTNIVRYVGISKNVNLRYLQHCRCEGLNMEKNLWVQDLLRLSMAPSLAIIDTVIGLNAAQKREKYWIDFYKQHGELLNVDHMERGR